MQEQDGKKQFNISERLEDLRREHEALRWEGSFREYFELVAQNPEEQLIDAAIAKRLRIRGKPKNRAEAKSLFDHLLRQGFAFELVSEKVRALATDYADEE